MSSMNLESCIQVLRARQQTVGFAESCTGGLLSAKMAAIAGVSDVFLGSLVSYSNLAKENLLGVSPHTLKLDGAVSDRVVRQMACGARKQLKTNWAVAITGIAGPSGGTLEKPVGTVWFAVTGPQVDVTEKKNFSGDRNQIQEQSAQFALELLLGELKRGF